MEKYCDTIYPCNYCGECPVWLAAFEPEVPELSTTEQVVNYCKNVRHCDLVGKEVPSDIRED